MEFLLISMIVGLDQISKYFVRMNLKSIGEFSLINGFFSLSYVENRGVAFGKLENQRWLIVGVTSIIILVMIYYFMKHKNLSKWIKLSFILIIAGALGNLIDRAFLNYVVDFISFINSNKYPVFNFADMCVISGTILLTINILFAKEKE